MQIGILGAGNVGGALGRGWVRRKHTVRFGVPDPVSDRVRTLVQEIGEGASAGSVSDAAGSADVLVLATPWSAVRSALVEAGNLAGKTLLDCTNPISADFSGLELGHTYSGGEQVAEWAPGAHVVKIFNTTGFNVMADPAFPKGTPAMCFCGDDVRAKQTAAQLAADLGFDPVDAGPLAQARQLEAMAWLWITMALKYGQGRDIAFALLRR